MIIKPNFIHRINPEYRHAKSIIGAWPSYERSATASLRDVTGNGADSTLSGTISSVMTPYGWSRDYKGGHDVIGDTTYIIGGSPASVFWVMNTDPTYPGDNASFQGVWALKNNAGANKGFVCWVSRSASYLPITIGNSEAGLKAMRPTEDITSLLVGVTSTNLWTFDGVNAALVSSFKYYVNGVNYPLEQSANTAAQTQVNFIGDTPTELVDFSGPIQNLVIFDTELNSMDAAELAVDPFIMYRDPLRARNLLGAVTAVGHALLLSDQRNRLVYGG